MNKQPTRKRKRDFVFGAYNFQRWYARKRGIGFELTYKEWLEIWQKSGHFQERGPRKGQYVMARFGDKGSYVVGNVEIITAEQNHRDYYDNIVGACERSASVRATISEKVSAAWRDEVIRARYMTAFSQRKSPSPRI